MLHTIIKFFLENKLVTALLLVLIIVWGVIVSPFNWKTGILPNDPVPVDAIPDLGENQQIVFTEWMGKSPQDVEDQITYLLTTAMLVLPGCSLSAPPPCLAFPAFTSFLMRGWNIIGADRGYWKN